MRRSHVSKETKEHGSFSLPSISEKSINNGKNTEYDIRLGYDNAIFGYVESNTKLQTAWQPGKPSGGQPAVANSKAVRATGRRAVDM